MENERGLSEFRSSYGYTNDEDDVSDNEEWQITRPSTSKCSRQSAISLSLLPPSKKPRIDSSYSKEKATIGRGPSLHLDSILGHSRTIIHVDIDCFYAQVEMVRNPELRNVPLGIQQKHIVVTCNYIARKRGVTKLSLISEAKKKCPDLVLVNGEDLTLYREFSGKVHSVLTREFTPLVERLGMDENFLDVTELVTARLQNSTSESRSFSGAVYSKNTDANEMKAVSSCSCGCHERLKLGSVIAAEIRQAILDEVGLTCCAGISHNKLLAKLVGGWKKPNAQTTLFPEDAESLLCGLKARDIPGIGHSTAKKLRTINVSSVTDLLSCPTQVLKKEFGNLQTTLIKLCRGIDDSPVTPSGDFKSVTDEDSFKKCSTLDDARKRLSNLIEGLLVRVSSSDCGVPETLKVTVRQREADKSQKRESRQCRLPHLSLDDQYKARQMLLTTCLQLFNKLVDVRQPFHLTLLGVSLSNFHKVPFAQSKNISNFFHKALSGENELAFLANSPPTRHSGVGELYQSYEDTNKINLSEHLGQNAEVGCYPSAQVTQKAQVTPTMEKSNPVVCPKGIDPAVFAELPPEVQRELEAQWQGGARIQLKNTATPKAKKCSGIQRYFAKDPRPQDSTKIK